jgi:hypothetical protein
MSKQMFSAGWNLPGCIPEMEPVLFDNEEDAKAFIQQEQEVAAESFYNDEDDTQQSDPYVYWVEVVWLSEEEMKQYEDSLV